MRLGFFRFIAVAILIGSLVYNDGNDISSKDVIDENGMTNSYAYNITSAVFIVVTLSLIGTAFAVPYLHSNMWQLKFEVASGLQGTVSSWCSLVLIDIPMYLVAATIISGVVFYMINIPGSSNSFFGIVLMATLAGYSLAAVCAIWIQSRQAAMIIFTAIGAFSLLFSGYFQVIPLLPLAWHWGTLVVYTRWAFEGLTVTAFQDSPSSDEFLSLYDFQDDSANYCLTWVVVWFICLQAIIVVGILPPIYKMELTSQSTIDTKLADPSVSSSYVAPNSLFEDEEKQQAAISIPSSPSFDRQPTNIAMEIYQRKESLNTLFRSDSSAGTGFNGDIEVASSSIVADALALLDDTAFQVVMAPKSTLTTLNFQRIKYIQATKGNTDIVEPRLQGISGILNPGSCCCIIDNGSDLSASLLLQILGGRCRFAGKTTGVIYANEMKLEKDTFYTNAAYVQRGDISYCSTMTVREVLYYSALLRRTDQRTCTNMGFITKYFFNTPDSDVSRLELIGKTGNVDERVNEVLQLMGLEGVADKVVGEVRSYSSTSRYNRRQFFNENSSVRFCLKKVSKTLHSKYKMLRNKVKPKTSITPAQLRCLTIGVELVNRPGLVFMEDPTGNLDWQDAEYVARVINSLAQGNRTVLCSVDKPSQGVLGMFSEVMVLGSSMLLYRGRTENAVDYFKNIGKHLITTESYTLFVLYTSI